MSIPFRWRWRPRDLLIALVQGYRLLLSPWLRAGCRYEPTCSGYALQALRRHGALAGTGLAAWRVLRCHPWCEGGCDAVPLQRPRLFARCFPSATTVQPPARPTAQPAGPPAGDPLSLTSSEFLP